jgi:hypothetical protein
LTVSRTKAVYGIDRDITWGVIGGTHCFDANVIKTVKYMRVGYALRLVLSVLLDRDVEISLIFRQGAHSFQRLEDYVDRKEDTATLTTQ